MKQVKVFVVNDKNEIVQDNSYNVIKVIKDSSNYISMLAADSDGDVFILRALKDFSVNPYRLTVRSKVLIPIIPEEDDQE